MKFGSRNLDGLLSALFQPRHYIAAGNMLRIYHRPAEMFGRYLLGRGGYPFENNGPHSNGAFHSHDLRP
jgi:hypothetical protein